MAFNGLALYDNGQLETTAEDVSPDVSLISPFETPLLDLFDEPERPAINVKHEYLSEQLAPVIIKTPGALTDSETSFDPQDVNGNAVAKYMRPGMVIESQTTGEQLLITAITGDTVTVTRGFASTTAAAKNADEQFLCIAEAGNEGDDVNRDTSRPRKRHDNVVQLFKKDVIVAGTRQAVQNLGGISDEYEHQQLQRTKEILRDLEKAIIRSRRNSTVVGGAEVDDVRTMDGLWKLIASNVKSDIAANALDPDKLDDVIELAWAEGGTDCDLIVCDRKWGRAIDSFNSSRTEVVQGSVGDETYKRRVTRYSGSYGDFQVLTHRWMPVNSLMVIASGRVKVVPLQGRQFQAQRVAKTGDSEKGFIVGEYTLEVHNEEGMARAYASS